MPPVASHEPGVTAKRVVIVDARIARRRRTGAAVYLHDLQAALAAADPPDLNVQFVTGPPGLPRRNALTTLGNLLVDSAWHHVLLPLVAKRRRADLIHAFFNWAPWWTRRRTVVTVHDVAWERVPETFPAPFRRYARLLTKHSARRATRVITTTQSTARDLTGLYRVAESRIRVIPIGVASDPEPSNPREPFVLAVGEFEPRKRIVELITGHRLYVRGAPADPPPCRLVLAGAGGSDEAAVRAAAGPECDVLGFVDDDTLGDLYRRATLLVYPSSYEGFGMPILEAMSHGCPALIANNSSLPEVGGDAALYIEAPTTDGIAAALSAALADREALRTRGEASREHASAFAWSQIAAQTLDTYREALKA